MPDTSPLDLLSPTPGWNHALRFAPRPAAAAPPASHRIALGAAVLALHALFALLLESQLRPHAQAGTRDDAIVVDWLVTMAPAVIRPPSRQAAPTPARASRGAATASPTHASTRTPRAPDTTARTNDAPLQLYQPDGSLRLPGSFVDDFDRTTAAQRRFDFEIPDIDKAGHWLDRPPVLAYEPTRFDRYWAPDENLLDKVLRKAVEKTTKEIRIPVPGAPGRTLVCKVSMLAMGGGCGVERYGSDIPRPGIDDPATLDPKEAAACQAWWERIVGPSTQAEWRATRKLYDAECRKPLLRVANPPPEPEPAMAGDE